MAKLKNTGMIRVGNAVLKERNPACFSDKNAHCFLLAEKCFLISKKHKANVSKYKALVLKYKAHILK